MQEKDEDIETTFWCYPVVLTLQSGFLLTSSSTTYLRRTSSVSPTMGILSLCADSGHPPGPTPPSLSSHDHTPPLSSLHDISDSTCNSSTPTTPSPPPTHPPPPIHIRLYAIPALWLHTTLCLKALLHLLSLLGLTISWLPLTILLLSTLYLSICFMAEEIDTLFAEDMAHNLTQTTRKQQQQDPATEALVHASFPLHIPLGTSLHDISALTCRAIILQAPHQQQQPPPTNRNWFTTQRHQHPTHGHHSDSSLLPTTTMPSWPWTLAISWLPLTQGWFPLLSDPLFSLQMWTTWNNLLSQPWKIILSWLTWLKMQRVSMTTECHTSDNLITPTDIIFLPWTCATFWSLVMNLLLSILHTPFFPSQPRTQQPSNWTQTPQK
jgi:hypothetical protein